VHDAPKFAGAADLSIDARRQSLIVLPFLRRSSVRSAVLAV